MRSEEHTSELQSRTVISYAVFCLKKKKRRALERASAGSRGRGLCEGAQPDADRRRRLCYHLCFFFFNDTATTEIYTTVHTLSLHDALPITAAKALRLELTEIQTKSLAA